MLCFIAFNDQQSIPTIDTRCFKTQEILIISPSRIVLVVAHRFWNWGVDLMQ